MHLGLFGLALLLFVLNGIVLAALLWTRRTNRDANRALAALVIVVALRMMPYVLGYSGAYDTYRWLTFAPFDLSLALGPLLWGYVAMLTTGARPPYWHRHFLPVLVQFGYSAICFMLPLEAKWNWYTGAHLSLVEPAGVGFALFSLAVYLVAARRRLVVYDDWLHQHLSNLETFRLGWLRMMLATTGAVLALATGYLVFAIAVQTPTYLERFPLMLALGALAYVVGGLGWRYGDTRYPVPNAVTDDVAKPAHSAETPSPIPVASPLEQPPDEISLRENVNPYRETARRWAADLRQEGWYRDDALTLATLAARLDTSPRTLSRVLGEGLGTTFHGFVNSARVEEVLTRLRAPDDDSDVMAIAFDAGFNSKASFNRVFRALVGMTPTAYRAAVRSGSLRDA